MSSYGLYLGRTDAHRYMDILSRHYGENLLLKLSPDYFRRYDAASVCGHRQEEGESLAVCAGRVSVVAHKRCTAGSSVNDSKIGREGSPHRIGQKNHRFYHRISFDTQASLVLHSVAKNQFLSVRNEVKASAYDDRFQL
jgi:hypothetical protein